MKKFQQYPPQVQFWSLKYWQACGLIPDPIKFEDAGAPDRTKLTKSEKRSLDERIKKYRRIYGI